MNSLVKQSLRILFGKSSISGIGVLFTIYFAYELPKNLFALIALYSTAASFTQVMIDLGLSAKMVREAPSLLKDQSTLKDAVDRVIMPSVVLRWMAAGIVCLIMFGFLQWMQVPLSDEFPDLNIQFMILIAPVSMMFENGNSTLSSIFQVNRRFGTDAMLASLATLLEMVFAFILYLNFGMSQYFTGVLAAQASIFLVRLYLCRETIRLFNSAGLPWKKYRGIVREYWPYYLRRFFRFGLLQGEQLLVAILLPLAQLADFNLAKKLSKYMKFYIEAFTNPLIMKLSKNRDIELRRRHARQFLLFTVPPPIILCLLSPWIMQIAGGEKYAGSWFILAILYASYVFYAFSNLQISAITIFGKGTDVLMRDAIGSVVGLCATFVLILLFGQYGLAWGQLLAYFTLFITGYQLSKKYIDSDTSVDKEKNKNKTPEPSALTIPD